MLITVKYNKPKKINTIQSAFLSFPYDAKIVDAIRTIPDRFYHVKEKTWEIPYNSIPILKNKIKEEWQEIGNPVDLDSLLDKKIKKKYTLPKSIKTKPYSFQEEDFNILMNYDKYLLLLPTGLGKSIVSLMVAAKRKELKQLNRCLIVSCVASLKFNWVNEIKKHTTLSVKILGDYGKSNISSQDKLNHLNNLDDTFFLVTNVESLRNKEILEKLKKLLRNGEIGMVVIDECHRCLEKDAKIITNKGTMRIEDIYNYQGDIYVLSYDEKNKKNIYRKVINKYKNNTNERKVKIKYCIGRYTRTLVCTESHKIFTKNRGWVKAGELRADDEILDYNDYETSCIICGNPTTSYKELSCCLSHGKKFSSSLYGISDKTRAACSAALKKLWKDKKFAKKKSEESRKRMLENNPVYMDGVVEKAMQTRKDNGFVYKNNFKYGNGKISPHEKLVFDVLSKYGFLFNSPINTKLYRERFPDIRVPNHYKPDFLNEEHKICIEVDGKDHRKKAIKEKDRKKEECLSYLGYKVFRLSHEEIDSEEYLERLDKIVKESNISRIC